MLSQSLRIISVLATFCAFAACTTKDNSFKDDPSTKAAASPYESPAQVLSASPTPVSP